jgi:alkylhydroperoxidase/carboxymuconolactone decarboxylase family protein YurZ
VGAGLESATRAHVRLGRKAGATPEELRHAALLAITTIGFPSMMRAMSWIDSDLATQSG